MLIAAASTSERTFLANPFCLIIPTPFCCTETLSVLYLGIPYYLPLSHILSSDFSLFLGFLSSFFHFLTLFFRGERTNSRLFRRLFSIYSITLNKHCLHQHHIQ